MTGLPTPQPCYVLRVVWSIWSAANLFKCSNGFCSCIVSVLFVNTSDKARNIQERWLVAILYSFLMRLTVLPASILRKHIVKMQIFYLIYLFIADTKSIVWTHTLCRTQVDKTDNTERSTRHWRKPAKNDHDVFRLCLFLAHSAHSGRLKKILFSKRQRCTEKSLNRATENVFSQINLFSTTLTTP